MTYTNYNTMTRIYYNNKRPLYNWGEKYRALIRQGYDESSASRMATNIPIIYG